MDLSQSTFSIEGIYELLSRFSEFATRHDREGSFVVENYRMLKEKRFFSALIPTELGGAGVSHEAICQILREIGHFCGSTALALSMHTHLVAAAVFRYLRGQTGEALMRKVAASELVLVSTGAGDWVDSVGRAQRINGGYKVRAIKRFCSGSPAGDLLLTSAPVDGHGHSNEVIHFAVPLNAPGVVIRDDWDTLGMRGTGSNTVELNDVVIPENAVSARRPQGEWHPMWDVIVAVAAPIFMSPYVGIAERAAELAKVNAVAQRDNPIVVQITGELEGSLTIARMAWREMLGLTDNFAVDPKPELSSSMLIRKTIVANACLACVSKAVEIAGGSAYYRQSELERLSRDINAAPFHPLPEKRQLEFTGRVTLGLSPVVKRNPAIVPTISRTNGGREVLDGIQASNLEAPE